LTLPAKYIYVLHSILLILTGVISTTRNVKIQFDADASDAAGVRMASGAYSAGTLTVRFESKRVGEERLTKPWNCEKSDGEEEIEEE
jgi:hypothetical protein